MKQLIAFVIIALAIPIASATAADPPRPNVVLIFIDDMGYGDVGFNGATVPKTPNLDQMAAEGVKFTDFYVGCAVCSGSRTALLTGCHYQRLSMAAVLFPQSKQGLHPEEVTIADMLKETGYRTACVGKWHLGHLHPCLPTDQGFDSYWGIPYSNDMWIDPANKLASDIVLREGLTLADVKAGHKVRNQVPIFRGDEVVEYPADQNTVTKRYTEEAIRFITEEKDEPFFLYLPHTMVHLPLAVSEAFDNPEKKLITNAIEEVDWSVGEILKTIKNAGIEDNTLVIFTSDNGAAVGSSLPLRARKGSVYDGGIREPTLMWWPGKIPAGSVCTEVAASIDVLPTLAGLSGGKLPERKIDGKDIWQLMSGKEGAKSPHENYVLMHGPGTVRSGKWKFYPWPEGKGNQRNAARQGEPSKDPVQLYDTVADIGERNNLRQEILRSLSGCRRPTTNMLLRSKPISGRPRRCPGLRTPNHRSGPAGRSGRPKGKRKVKSRVRTRERTDFGDTIRMNPAFRRALLPCLLCLPWLTALAAEKPNVILFMADDMGMGDTSAYQDFTGNADEVQLATPNMERLARMGVRFTDAHTPASRCTTTRYGLLTGRYAFRNRLKYWVLFGSQGDPMIERDRPTVATLFREKGYGTAVVGKWHVGLRYRQSNCKPAAGWNDADLTQPLFDTPLDHGFDYARFTSRSHGTSGPGAGQKNKAKRNGPKQSVGPGHIHGRAAVGATGNGKALVTDGPDAYVLTRLGSRHSDHAIEWLDANHERPFFLYYPSNSNHGPYTPDDAIGGVLVKGAARTKSGEPMDARHDYIYENDVALGRLLDYLEANDDPRHPGKKLIETTVVIFTSDNGAEKNSDIASGPFRSHKGSCFEGGHRVPFLVAWGAGGIGDGSAETPGRTDPSLIGLTDLYATFAEMIGADLPDLAVGEKGAEDSFSVLSAWKGETLAKRPPLFFHDHKEAEDDQAVAAMRLDSPTVHGRKFKGQWKIFFDASLLREGKAKPFALYELSSDQREENDRLHEPDLASLVEHLKEVALLHRNAGGHRLAKIASDERLTFDWPTGSELALSELAKTFKGPTHTFRISLKLKDDSDVELQLDGHHPGDSKEATGPPAELEFDAKGLGIRGSDSGQVNAGERLEVRFDRDVIIESVALIAGEGECGGFYQVGDAAPLAIYCVDADIDAKDQHGIISDIGVLKKGETLRLDSSPHYGVEAAGDWRLAAVKVRKLEDR